MVTQVFALQAEQMTRQLQRLTPRQMSLILGVVRIVQRAKQAIYSRKLLVLSIIMLIVALLLRWTGFL